MKKHTEDEFKLWLIGHLQGFVMVGVAAIIWDVAYGRNPVFGSAWTLVGAIGQKIAKSLGEWL